ncbi:MAG: thiamine phosphate synthase [Gammaproteobacteria bacterium]|nr:thiamine phosphate synthase [Gammaproteobacteria bacterium]
MTFSPRFSDFYLITPPFSGDVASYLAGLQSSLLPDVRLVRLRLGLGVDRDVARHLVTHALDLCLASDTRLLLDRSTIAFGERRCGVHLDSKTLMEHQVRPGDVPFVAASCHNGVEIEHACALGVDWIVVSPILPTASHPGAATLGWDGLERLVTRSTVPVYALGGLGRQDLERARQMGAAGIAAIRGLWKGVV